MRRSGAPSQLSVSLSTKRKSLADDTNDDDHDENEKPKASAAPSRFSAPFTKTDMNASKKSKNKIETYDASKFRSEFRKPLVNSTNNNEKTNKSATASSKTDTSAASKHVNNKYL